MFLGQTRYLPAACFYSSGGGSQGGTFCREREQGERGRRKQMWQNITGGKGKPVAFNEDAFVRCFFLYNACVLLFSFFQL